MIFFPKFLKIILGSYHYQPTETNPRLQDTTPNKGGGNTRNPKQLEVLEIPRIRYEIAQHY
jgi:hypothetical protein